MPQLHPAQLAGIEALAAEMRAQGTGRDEPVREVSALLGDRWTTLILLVLDTGTWRHADLRRPLSHLSAEGRISQRVLTLKLKALARNGFVQREATEDVPPHVSYALTPLGRSLKAEARRLIDWVAVHRADIDSARSRANFKSWSED